MKKRATRPNLTSAPASFGRQDLIGVAVSLLQLTFAGVEFT